MLCTQDHVPRPKVSLEIDDLPQNKPFQKMQNGIRAQNIFAMIRKGAQRVKPYNS
jgi:hypothetical protein